MSIENQLKALAKPSLSNLGYEIVRVRLRGGFGKRVLQIMIDRFDETPVSLEDCAIVSRQLSAVLDVEDPISGNYNLEISSPGIARPLVKERDFERFLGFTAKVELEKTIRGRKRFRGRLVGCDRGIVSIQTEQGEEELPISDIAAASLLLSDDLIEEHRKKSAEISLH
ncbi:MAG: ribosome maturation factor RimP [Pseudomonadota bacterium]|nr:ribosome maturation factor RimP [Pseudomonadota bacterium]